MKKAEQQQINIKVCAMIDRYNDLIDLHLSEPTVAHRLDYCQAEIIDIIDTRTGAIEMHALRSYNTIIALYVCKSDTLYDFLRYVYGYTATSAKHIAKFRNRFRPEQVYTYREV